MGSVVCTTQQFPKSKLFDHFCPILKLFSFLYLLQEDWEINFQSNPMGSQCFYTIHLPRHLTQSSNN